MICPVCAYDNIQGEDNCENCGADLRTVDIPQPPTEFHGRLLGEHLDALGVSAPPQLGPSAPVGEAIRLMRESGSDAVLVTEGGRLVGILTERDAVVKLAGRPLEGITAGEVMTPDPVVLRHTDTIAVAINKMAVGGFRHIPIVENGTAIGVVSAKDVFHHILISIR